MTTSTPPRPTLWSVKKVAGAGIGGAVATIVIYVVEQYTGNPIPAHVASSLAVLLSVVVGYVVPDPNG
jgi:hypothetical protein